MRSILVTALVALLSVTAFAPDTAFAGKKDKSSKNKKDKADKGESPAAMVWMSEDKSHELDKIFVKAEAPMNKVVAAETALADADAKLGELIAKIKETGGNPMEVVSVTLEGTKPKIAAKGDFEAQGNAVSEGYAAAVDAVMALKDVPADVQATIDAAKGADPKALAASPAEIMKIPKTLSTNMKVLGSLPGKVESLMTTVKDLPAGIKTKIGG